MVKREMIIKFKDKKEYEEWLAPQSWAVREKAKIFKQVFGDVVPIVIEVWVDENQTGEPGVAHIFLHPSGEKLIDFIIVEYSGDYK